jgi:hypothetical protein
METLGVLAKKNKDIRKKILDLLIDMLNDEIDEVRIGALHCISMFNEVLELNVSLYSQFNL